MAKKRYWIGGEECEYEDGDIPHKPELKVLSNLNYTPRIPRQLVEFYKKYPKQTKILHFIYSYSYKAIMQNKFRTKEEDIYRGIELSQNDFIRWFRMSRNRRIEKLEELKKISSSFAYEMKKDKLIVDHRINFSKKLNYLAELSQQESTLTNNQLRFLKLIQSRSRIEQVFNFKTLVEMRTVENKSNPRTVKRDVLKDLKIFQEIGVITKVEYLDCGRQVKLRVWKEMKGGVGRRLKKVKK